MGDRINMILSGAQAPGEALGRIGQSLGQFAGVVEGVQRNEAQKLKIILQVRKNGVDREAIEPGAGQSDFESKVGKWLKPETLAEHKAIIAKEGKLEGMKLAATEFQYEGTRNAFADRQVGNLLDDIESGRVTPEEARQKIYDRLGERFTDEERESAINRLDVGFREKREAERKTAEIEFRTKTNDAVQNAIQARSIWADKLTQSEKLFKDTGLSPLLPLESQLNMKDSDGREIYGEESKEAIRTAYKDYTNAKRNSDQLDAMIMTVNQLQMAGRFEELGDFIKSNASRLAGRFTEEAQRTKATGGVQEREDKRITSGKVEAPDPDGPLFRRVLSEAKRNDVPFSAIMEEIETDYANDGVALIRARKLAQEMYGTVR